MPLKFRLKTVRFFHQCVILAAVLCLQSPSVAEDKQIEEVKKQMWSEKDKQLASRGAEMRKQIDPLRSEVNAANKELSDYYAKNPSAEKEAAKVPEPPMSTSQSTPLANKVDDENKLRTKLTEIINQQKSQLQEGVETESKETEKQKRRKELDEMFKAASKESEECLKSFNEQMDKLVKELEDERAKLQQSKDRVVAIVKFITGAPFAADAKGEFALAVRDALSKSKSLDSLNATSPSSTPAPNLAPVSNVGAEDSPVASAQASPSPANGPTPAAAPAPAAPSETPPPEISGRETAEATNDKIKELYERVSKNERSLVSLETSNRDAGDQKKRLDTLEKTLQAHDTVFSLRAKVAQETETKISALEDKHRIWLVVLSLLTLLAAAGGGAAFFKRTASPVRANSATMADHSARAGVQDLLQRVEALESSAKNPEAAGPVTAQSAGPSHEELAALSRGIEKQVNELRSAIKTEAEEVSRLRSLLVLDPENREHAVRSLHDGLVAARSVAEPLLASVDRLQGRLQLDNFRKVTRDRVEPQMLQDACARIRATLDDARHHADSLPAQVYVWDEARLQQVIDSVKGVERDAAKVATLRTVLVRLLLSTYRSAGLREPMDKALDLAEDLKLLAPSDGPLRWTMECDGQGISADPADDRALWHLRGAKRAGNRTVLFPLVTENGAKLFAGVVTYEV